MRALRIHRHGQPVLDANVLNPIAGSDEAVVELACAGINPVDVFIMLGQIAPEAPLPRILGIDGAGYLEGKPVMVHGAGVGVFRDGTLAERVAAPSVAIVPIPDGVSLETATGCGNAGATAIRLFQLAEAEPGDCALVLAASGSVGAAICSLLAAAGVRVWGQIRREPAAEFVRAAGGMPLLAETPAVLASALAGEQPNILFDPLGGKWTEAATDLLPLDARHIVYGSITGQMIEFDLRKFYRRSGTMRSYRGIMEPPERIREAVELALAAVADGRLRIPLGSRVPLSSAAQAYDLIRTSHTGRIVVEIAR
jgi:NADPH2:quinone reductase